MTPDYATAIREQLWRSGFRPVALYNHDDPGPSPGKRPAGNGWQHDARRDPPRWAVEQAQPNATNTGILAEGLRAIDEDIDDPSVAGDCTGIALAKLGPALIRTRRNSSRRLLLYRAAEGEPPKRSIVGRHGKIEVLGKGQQFVAFGVHASGVELEWLGEPPGLATLDDLTAITEEQISDFFAECAAIIGAPSPNANGHDQEEHVSGEPRADQLRLAAAMASISNDQPADWEFWNRLGMALWTATAGSDDGLACWIAWSSRHPSYDADATRARWRHYSSHPPAKLGAGTIFRIAAEAAATKEAGSEGNGAADDPWAQPRAQTVPPEPPDLSVLHLNRRPPPVFPLDVFGDSWAAWIRATAAAACCPVDYVAAPLLATASALIGNARWAEGTPGWAEPPVLWTASVGDSGDGKSPGSDVILGQLVPELERRMVGDFPDKHREWLTAVEMAKAKETQWSAAVVAAQKKGGQPPLRPADLDPGPEPQMPRLRQGDVTIEKVAQLLAEAAPKGLLMMRDELAGFLLGMNVYHDGARPFWLEAYGGRPYTVERVRLAEPLRVPRMTCAWFGTIQPERLAELLALPDDGLLARFIMFWPDPVPFRPAETATDVGFALTALDRLRALEMYQSEGRQHPVVMPLVRPAWPRLVEFANAMQADQKMTEGLLRSAYGKTRGLALRLSLILELLRWAGADPDFLDPGPPGAISETAFADACRLVSEYIIPMAVRTYGDAAANKAERGAAMLARWMVRSTPRPSEIHVRTMQRKVRLAGLNTAEGIHAACKVLTEAGWLLPSPPIGGVNRARAAYPVNPGLWEAWDGR